MICPDQGSVIYWGGSKVATGTGLPGIPVNCVSGGGRAVAVAAVVAVAAAVGVAAAGHLVVVGIVCHLAVVAVVVVVVGIVGEVGCF
mgnify:FL=1